MNTESMQKNYLKKAEKENIKYVLTTMFALLMMFIGMPYMITIVVKETYPQVEWINQAQLFLMVVGGMFTLSIVCVLFLKERNKPFSNLLFESSQASILMIFVFGAHVLFIIALNDLWIKGISIILFLFGMWKVFMDLRRKKQDHTHKIINQIEKYASILFISVIIIRWLLEFFFGQDNNIEASIIGALFPILIVIVEVFIVEYSIKQITTLVNFMKYPEKYREALDISMKDWYGSKSVQYKKMK